MADVFEGKPDDRQAQEQIKPTRFRPRYRQLTDSEKAVHDEIKRKAEELEHLYNQALVLASQRSDDISAAARYKALAITSLEESVMWAVKGLTS